MSHFTVIKTEIKDKKTLLESLVCLGYTFSEDTVVHDYRHNLFKVDIAIHMSNGYDIGFYMNKEGFYEVIADWWGVQKIKDADFIKVLEAEFIEVQKRIKRDYTINLLMNELKNQNFQVADVKEEIDGRICILARRWEC